MTLIVSAGTRDFLVQVSDRRLTDLRTGAAVENMAIKAVVYCNFMVVGYTGVSRIAGERTDIWIADQLQTVPSPSRGSATGRLQEAVEEVFGGRRSPPPLALVALGWYSNPEDEDLHPSVARISNFHDEDGNRLPDPQGEFHVEAKRYAPPMMFVHTAGIAPPQTEMISLGRTIRRALS